MPFEKVSASPCESCEYGAQSQPPVHDMKRPLTSIDGSKMTWSVCSVFWRSSDGGTSNVYRRNWSTATPRVWPLSLIVAPILMPSKTRRFCPPAARHAAGAAKVVE